MAIKPRPKIPIQTHHTIKWDRTYEREKRG